MDVHGFEFEPAAQEALLHKVDLRKMEKSVDSKPVIEWLEKKVGVQEAENQFAY